MTAVTLPEATGDGDHTYSVTPMVAGLSFNPTSRVLSGTPTVADTYPMTYTATSSGGDKASLSFTVEVLSSFLGTWASSGQWEDDQELVTWKQALTFTKSRYILHRSHYRAGTSEYTWVSSGTWDATDSTITRIWLDNHDDDDDTPDVETSVRKHYLWGESRSTLCMQHWGNDREELDNAECDRYERVPRPAPADLLGTWTSANPDDRWQYTIELTTAAEFKATLENAEEGRTVVLTGTYEVVPDELFIFVTVADFVDDGVSRLPNPDSAWKAGVRSRWAFAPTATPNRLAVSNHWDETNPNPDGPGFVDGDDLPYGYYRLEVEKQ